MMNANKKHVIVKSLLAACLLAGSSISAVAQTDSEFQPVVVASISSAGELLSDLSSLGEMIGMKDLDWTALTQNEDVVEALDKTRPIGTIVRTDGSTFESLGFLPVQNIDALFEALEPIIGTPSDNGDGIYEIDQPIALYVKHENGWAFVSQTMDVLSDLPEDPASLLGHLDQEYDVAIRAHIHNVPQIFRQMAIGWIQFGVQEELSQLDGLDDSQSELRRQWMNNSLKQMNSLINETDTITLGWDVDQSGRQVQLDMGMTAVAGTTSAERMKTIKLAASEHAGFLLDDAAATLHFHSEMSPEDILNTVQMLNGVKVGALEYLDDDEGFSTDESREKAQQVLGGLFDIVASTVESGVLEGGAAIFTKPDSLSLVTGGRLQDGEALEQNLRNLANLVQEEDGFPKVQWNTGEVQGIRLHSLQLPIEDERLAKILGDRLQIVLGTGPQQGYVALGDGAEDLLKRVIDKSAEDRNELLAPSQIVVALSPIVKYLESLRDDFPELETMADIEVGASGRDRVIAKTVPIENGVMSRIVIEEDALRVLGALGQALGEQFRAAAAAQFDAPLEPGLNLDEE